MSGNIQQVEDILQQVTDPEIPVLSLQDLGVIRNIEVTNNKIAVTITPTYS
ncbi:1,2-phenylacetyl-CoA epoxidase, subunit D, partial [hydrothermal vent metagenome]